MRIDVKVIPNAKKEEITLKGKNLNDGLIVKVKSPAEDGKANKELIKILEKYFNKKVNIVHGEKSRKKIIEIEE
ncbi:MAG: DUF167 domain-containing protein [Candidatus Altarchaeaceae archaeon]